MFCSDHVYKGFQAVIAIHTMRRKLLFVINDVDYFFAHWAARAHAALSAGYDVHIAAPGEKKKVRVTEKGFTFHSIPLTRKGTTPWKEMKSVLSIYRLYRFLQPDLVHLVTIKPVIYGGIAGRMVHVPAVVSSIPGLGSVFSASGPKACLMRRGISRAYRFALAHHNSRVIFENSDDYKDFQRKGLVTAGSAVLIKGAGVDMQVYKPTPETSQTPLVILASRMLWSKGVEDFIEAARRIHSVGIQARFALVGDSDHGNPACIHAEQLKAWNDSGVVEWWGQQNNMPEVFAQAHIVCLPSFYREGIPRVLIEAAACGKPIVTTDTPGCREIARHGNNGLLVPPRNPVALAEALKTIILDSALRSAMGSRGREIAVAEFSQEQVLRETLAVYRELLS